MLGLFREAYSLYRDEGLTGLATGIRQFIDRRLPFTYVSYYKRREDNEDRWRFIEPYLSETESLIDVGCAEGFFTSRAADSGILAIGIDTDSGRLQRARKHIGFQDGCAFLRRTLDPKNIHQLPYVDTVLLLTIHHHWEREFGLEASEAMFRVVMDRCDRLIYEPPGDRPILYDHADVIPPDDAVEFHTGRLSALYGDDIDILDVETFPRISKERRIDPLFIIDSSGYELDTTRR